MYTGLSKEICETAWSITLTSVEHAARTGITDKFAGTIVVGFLLGKNTFEVTFLADVNPDNPNTKKYGGLAIEMACVSGETGLPSRRVEQNAPHLYQQDTTCGSSVIENGLVVAFSGVDTVFDEAIAGTMLRWIVALLPAQDDS